MNDFEGLMIAKIVMRTAFEYTDVADIFGFHRTYIGKIVDKYHPYWKQVGEDLSQLKVPPSYARSVLPDGFLSSDNEKVFGLIDGKDFMTGTVGNSSVIRRAATSTMTLCVSSSPFLGG